jgi:hypothetical protein
MFFHCLTPLVYTEITVTTIFPDHCQFSHIGFYNIIHGFYHIFKITENEGLHDSWVNRQVTMYSLQFCICYQLCFHEFQVETLSSKGG